MRDLLFPRLYIKGLADIPLSELQARGIDSLIFDLDNTITTWNSNEISEEMAAWFRHLQDQGFRALILSNNHALRIEAVAARLSLPFMERARKPRRSAYFRAMELLGSGPANTAVVGDQIFTDVLGGNRSGLFTILVSPLAWREFPGTKITRLLEKPVLWQLRRKRDQGRIY